MFDAHIHFLDHAIYELFTASLYDTKSPDELVEVMKKYNINSIEVVK